MFPDLEVLRGVAYQEEIRLFRDLKALEDDPVLRGVAYQEEIRLFLDLKVLRVLKDFKAPKVGKA